MELEELTEEQKALAIKVAEEWKSKLGNIKINKEDVAEGLEFLYSKINKPLPQIVWVCSPLAVYSTYPSIESTAGKSVTGSVYEALKKSVFVPVEEFIDSVSGTSARYFVSNVVRSLVRDFGRSLNKLMELLFLCSGFLGCKGVGSVYYWEWMAWIDYWQRIGIKHGKEKEVAKILKMQSAYSYFPYENVVIVCEHPMYPPKMNGEGRMHSDGSSAIEWEDGFKIWCLNEVVVSQYLAETPAGKLDLEWYLQEKNAEVRAQFILKYGIDRMSGLGKVVDSYKDYEGINEYWKKSEYELIDMASIHEDMEKALYLKMKNQTVDGVYHLEGVSNDCNTIYDAIKCRWNGIDPSQYVTINIK